MNLHLSAAYQGNVLGGRHAVKFRQVMFVRRLPFLLQIGKDDCYGKQIKTLWFQQSYKIVEL